MFRYGSVGIYSYIQLYMYIYSRYEMKRSLLNRARTKYLSSREDYIHIQLCDYSVIVKFAICTRIGATVRP